LSDRDLENAFLETLGGENPVVKEPKISHRQSSDEGAELLDRLLMTFVPDGVSGAERDKANEILWSAAKLAAETERLDRDIDHLRRDIWEPFEQRARVLDQLGYIDFASQTATPEGKWLADLRVDRPLLVGEALRQAVFDGLEPGVLAGLMAALAADSDRNYGELYLSDELLSRIADLEEVIYEVSRTEWK